MAGRRSFSSNTGTFYLYHLALFSSMLALFLGHSMVLSKYRLASSMLPLHSQKTVSLFTGHTGKSPRVYSHGSPGVVYPELIMGPRTMERPVSPCPGHLHCLGLGERSKPHPNDMNGERGCHIFSLYLGS